MRTIVIINCPNKTCFQNRLKAAKSFLPKSSWVSIDVSEKSFASTRSFVDFALLKKYSSYFKFEADLMVGKNKIYRNRWFNSPFRRLLFYQRTVTDWKRLLNMTRRNRKVLGIALEAAGSPQNPAVPAGVKFVQILAVSPGPSGQKFDKKTLSLIRFLRKNHPRVKISVDGGINLQTARLCKKAGANIVSSSSYIWDSQNPKEAYKKLSRI